MAVHSVLKPKQDLPPPGGYKKIKWTSGVPKRGMSGLAMFGWVGLYMIPAYYLFVRNLDLFYYRKREQYDARLAIMPFIMAERDRKTLLSLRRNFSYEEELMWDIDGWQIGRWFDEPIFESQDQDRWFEPRINDTYLFCGTPATLTAQQDRHFY